MKTISYKNSYFKLFYNYLIFSFIANFYSDIFYKYAYNYLIFSFYEKISTIYERIGRLVGVSHFWASEALPTTHRGYINYNTIYGIG